MCGTYNEELWNQTHGVPLTAQSFASYASMASYWTSLSFNVFVCKNCSVIPPFQVDVTSNWDHALEASGSLDINSILVHLSFPSLSSWCLRPCLHHLGGSPTDIVLHKVHIQHIHACTHTHTHTDVILSAQSKQFRITDLQSQFCSRHSTSSSAPSPGKKEYEGWTRKENDTAEGRRKQQVKETQNLLVG